MTRDEEQALWVDYRRDGGLDLRNRLVECYLPLAGKAAAEVRSQWPFLRLDYDDLSSAACVGIIQAVERFDPARGARPLTYLYRRARGAVLDWLRETGATARSRRKGRGVLRLSLDAFSETVLEGHESHAADLAVEHPDFRRVDDRDQVERLLASRCTPRQRQVVGLRYDAGMDGRAAAAALGLTPQYVSLLHNAALAELRAGKAATP